MKTILLFILQVIFIFLVMKASFLGVKEDTKTALIMAILITLIVTAVNMIIKHFLPRKQ